MIRAGAILIVQQAENTNHVILLPGWYREQILATPTTGRRVDVDCTQESRCVLSHSLEVWDLSP